MNHKIDKEKTKKQVQKKFIDTKKNDPIGMKIMFIHKLRASDSSCCRIVGRRFIIKLRRRIL